ncbi:MAG: DNA polymerase III subunit beta [Actinobacteria bacterium]|nr:DNA polymerase III subunit beta [Actinomycetota bacterium]
MKFQTTKDNLLNELLFINRSLVSKPTIQVLNGVLMEANKLLDIYATDLETSIKTTLEVDVIKEGKILAPIKLLTSILKTFPEAKIEVELLSEKNQLKIACQNAVFIINTYSIEDFPQFPEVRKGNQVSIDSKRLKNLISKSIKSVSTDENRPVLTGVLIEISNNIITMVSTDSYRLSLAKDEIDYSNSLLKAIIPSRVLDSILKTDLQSELVEINIDENQISFNIFQANNKAQNLLIISRLISGKFPEYKQLIPSSFKHTIILDRDRFLEVIRRVSSISQDNIPIKLEATRGKVNVSMSIKGVGSSSENLDVEYGGEGIEIAFNPDFLLDGVSMMDDKQIVLNIEESLRPALIKQNQKENLLYLLMPVRIS